jgi:uncharacterized protein YqeY
MIEAMKSKDKDSLNTLRLLKSAIDLYLVNNKLDRNNASDEVVIDVVSKQVKTHRESIEEFKKGNRQDLIDNLTREIELLSKYLPEQLSSEELVSIVENVFNEVKPSSVKDMGAIMKAITPLVKGKADMREVNALIKEKLNNL